MSESTAPPATTRNDGGDDTPPSPKCSPCGNRFAISGEVVESAAGLVEVGPYADLLTPSQGESS